MSDQRTTGTLSKTISAKSKRRIIRSYFLVSFLLVGFGILASGLLGIYYHLSDIRAHSSELQQEIAAGAAYKIERFIHEIEETLRTVPLSREIIATGLSPEIDFQLHKLLKISPPVNELMVADAKGVIYRHISRIRSVALTSKQSISSSAAFAKAMDGKTYYGGVFFIQESEPHMTITVPIERYAGEIIGVLEAQVNLRYIRDLISSIQFGNGGYAYVVSRYGDLIAHPSISLVLKRPNLSSSQQVLTGFAQKGQSPQRSSTLVTTSINGSKVLSSFTSIPHLDWLVVIEQPWKEALEKFFSALFRTTALLVFGLGMAFIASALLIRKVLQPLEDLRKGAEAIGSGDLDYRLEVKTGDEFELVADEFNNMAGTIQDSHTNLEKIVEARTREIAAANVELETARKELEELNLSLEEKVKSQVQELERINRIKHFLPPSVSEAILQSDIVNPFQTHRKEVTVVFIDLRGFTGFSDNHEPEEVMLVLRQYHTVVGSLIDKYEGTLEHFAGDGIMVFFNDPLPQANHLEVGIRMSLEVQQKVAQIRPEWHTKGYQLDVGIGLTTGYATLGILGFEGRLEYGVIGNVPNLAARLSGEAEGGQIVIDGKAYARISNVVEVQPLGELSLKGFARKITAYNIIGLRS